VGNRKEAPRPVLPTHDPLAKIIRSNELNAVESSPGTYALILRSPTEGVIRIGRLGNMQIKPGWYVYVGSAFGPGGVRARLAHHIRPVQRPHWHIDYLKTLAVVEEVWFVYGQTSQEHAWSECFAGMRGASLPMAGFGSSDCHCESHLFYFKKRPPKKLLTAHRAIV